MQDKDDGALRREAAATLTFGTSGAMSPVESFSWNDTLDVPAGNTLLVCPSCGSVKKAARTVHMSCARCIDQNGRLTNYLRFARSK